MNLIRLIAWKEFKHIKSDPLMVRLMIFPVIAQLFVLGYALTIEVKNVPIAILDRSRTPQSVSLVSVIKQNPLFVYRGGASSEEEIHEMIDDGKVKIALMIPYDFSLKMNLAEGAKVQLLSDGQDANTSNVAMGYLNSIISGWMFEKLKMQLASKGVKLEFQIPVKVQKKVFYNPMLKSSWFMIPALVVILVTMVTSLLTAFSIVKEKENGTLEQIMVTPVKPIHMVFGKIIPFTIIGMLEIIAFLVIALIWFDIPFKGNFVTLFLFALIYMISSLGIGILVSTLAKTSQQVLFLIWFILMFFILLSGFFIPIDNMPGWVQYITNINPVRFFMLIVREIFLKGSGIYELWHQALRMLVIGMIVFGLSLVAFQKKAG